MRRLRLRNRGNVAAENIRLDFWYQRATAWFGAGWIPVQNADGVTQVLTGQSLAAGAEAWFAVDWAPVDDGTHHHHWCVKVIATVAGDTNADNKMAFRNFNDVGAADTDTFDTLVRFAEWTDADRIDIVPRGPATTLVIDNLDAFPKAVKRRCNLRAGQRRLVHGAPMDMAFARLRIENAKLDRWDGRSTALPADSRAFYPVDPRTLPPGVEPDEMVTVTHVRDGQPFGGVSYRLPRK